MDTAINFNDKKQRKKIWYPRQLQLLTIIFSFIPVTPFYVLICNTLGLKRKRNIFLIIILIFLLSMFMLSFIISEKAVITFGVMFNLIIALYINSSLSKEYNTYLEEGGKKAKIVTPTIVGIIYLLILLFLFVLGSPTTETKTLAITYYDDIIFYDSDVSYERAKEVGDFLDEYGFFNDNPNNLMANLSVENNKYIITIYVKELYRYETTYKTYFGMMKHEMDNKELLNGLFKLYYNDYKFNPKTKNK